MRRCVIRVLCSVLWYMGYGKFKNIGRLVLSVGVFFF